MYAPSDFGHYDNAQQAELAGEGYKNWLFIVKKYSFLQ